MSEQGKRDAPEQDQSRSRSLEPRGGAAASETPRISTPSIAAPRQDRIFGQIEAIASAAGTLSRQLQSASEKAERTRLKAEREAEIKDNQHKVEMRSLADAGGIHARAVAAEDDEANFFHGLSAEEIGAKVNKIWSGQDEDFNKFITDFANQAGTTLSEGDYKILGEKFVASHAGDLANAEINRVIRVAKEDVSIHRQGLLDEFDGSLSVPDTEYLEEQLDTHRDLLLKTGATEEMANASRRQLKKQVYETTVKNQVRRTSILSKNPSNKTEFYESMRSTLETQIDATGDPEGLLADQLHQLNNLETEYNLAVDQENETKIQETWDRAQQFLSDRMDEHRETVATEMWQNTSRIVARLRDPEFYRSLDTMSQTLEELIAQNEMHVEAGDADFSQMTERAIREVQTNINSAVQSEAMALINDATHPDNMELFAENWESYLTRLDKYADMARDSDTIRIIEGYKAQVLNYARATPKGRKALSRSSVKEGLTSNDTEIREASIAQAQALLNQGDTGLFPELLDNLESVMEEGDDVILNRYLRDLIIIASSSPDAVNTQAVFGWLDRNYEDLSLDAEGTMRILANGIITGDLSAMEYILSGEFGAKAEQYEGSLTDDSMAFINRDRHVYLRRAMGGGIGAGTLIDTEAIQMIDAAVYSAFVREMPDWEPTDGLAPRLKRFGPEAVTSVKDQLWAYRRPNGQNRVGIVPSHLTQDQRDLLGAGAGMPKPNTRTPMMHLQHLAALRYTGSPTPEEVKTSGRPFLKHGNAMLKEPTADFRLPLDVQPPEILPVPTTWGENSATFLIKGQAFEMDLSFLDHEVWQTEGTPASAGGKVQFLRALVDVEVEKWLMGERDTPPDIGKDSYSEFLDSVTPEQINEVSSNLRIRYNTLYR